MPEIDKREINRSPFIVIVAVFCLIISGCLGGGTMGDLPDCETLYGAGVWTDCQGTLTYAYGEYVGEWKGGQFHGQGILTWPDGSKYVGEFKDGKHHGQGTFTYADGFQEEGRWQDGNFLG